MSKDKTLGNIKGSIDECISGARAFLSNYKGILELLPERSKDYINKFVDVLADVIVDKKSEYNQRFFSLFLLVKASELNLLHLIGQIATKKEMLSVLEKQAQYDKDKQIDTRGKTFFNSVNPTANELTMGRNYIKLVIEALKYYSIQYGTDDKKKPESIFNEIYYRLENEKVKFSDKYSVIGKSVEDIMGVKQPAATNTSSSQPSSAAASKQDNKPQDTSSPSNPIPQDSTINKSNMNKENMTASKLIKDNMMAESNNVGGSSGLNKPPKNKDQDIINEIKISLENIRKIKGEASQFLQVNEELDPDMFLIIKQYINEASTDNKKLRGYSDKIFDIAHPEAEYLSQCMFKEFEAYENICLATKQYESKKTTYSNFNTRLREWIIGDNGVNGDESNANKNITPSGKDVEPKKDEEIILPKPESIQKEIPKVMEVIESKEIKKDPIETRKDLIEVKKDSIEVKNDPIEAKKDPIEAIKDSIEARKDRIEVRKAQIEENHSQKKSPLKEPKEPEKLEKLEQIISKLDDQHIASKHDNDNHLLESKNDKNDIQKAEETNDKKEPHPKLEESSLKKQIMAEEHQIMESLAVPNKTIEPKEVKPFELLSLKGNKPIESPKDEQILQKSIRKDSRNSGAGVPTGVNAAEPDEKKLGSNDKKMMIEELGDALTENSYRRKKIEIGDREYYSPIRFDKVDENMSVSSKLSSKKDFNPRFDINFSNYTGKEYYSPLGNAYNFVPQALNNSVRKSVQSNDMENIPDIRNENSRQSEHLSRFNSTDNLAGLNLKQSMAEISNSLKRSSVKRIKAEDISNIKKSIESSYKVSGKAPPEYEGLGDIQVREQQQNLIDTLRKERDFYKANQANLLNKAKENENLQETIKTYKRQIEDQKQEIERLRLENQRLNYVNKVNMNNNNPFDENSSKYKAINEENLALKKKIEGLERELAQLKSNDLNLIHSPVQKDLRERFQEKMSAKSSAPHNGIKAIINSPQSNNSIDPRLEDNNSNPLSKSGLHVIIPKRPKGSFQKTDSIDITKTNPAIPDKIYPSDGGYTFLPKEDEPSRTQLRDFLSNEDTDNVMQNKPELIPQDSTSNNTNTKKDEDFSMSNLMSAHKSSSALAKQIKGILVDQENSVIYEMARIIPYSEGNNKIEMFKRACLKSKCLVYGNSLLQVGATTNIIRDQLTHRNHLKMGIYYGNKLLSEPIMNFTALLKPNDSFQVVSKPDMVDSTIPPQKQAKQQLIINFLKFPFSCLQMDCQISARGENLNFKIYLPTTINKFMGFKPVDTTEFKAKWKILKYNVLKTVEIQPDVSVVKDISDFKNYFDFLIDLSLKNEYDFILGKKNIKLGGCFELDTPGVEYLLKINLLPKKTVIFQLACHENYTELGAFVLQTLGFLFKVE